MQVSIAEDGLYNMERGWLPSNKEEEMFRTGAAMLYLKEAVYMRFKDLDAKYGTGALRIGTHENERKKHTYVDTISFEYLISIPSGNELVISSPNGFVLPSRHLHFRRDLNRILDRLVSMGFAQGLQRKYYPKEALIQAREKSDEVPIITVSHIIGPILVLLACYIACTIVFILEKMCARKY